MRGFFKECANNKKVKHKTSKDFSTLCDVVLYEKFSFLRWRQDST